MSRADKELRLASHFQRLFNTFIVADYRTQMDRWSIANGEIISLAVDAQGKWRQTLENAKVRKKMEAERQAMLLSLALGMMSGVAFGFISSAVQAKIGQKYGQWVTKDVVAETDDYFFFLKMPKHEYNGKMGQLMGSTIEQFEDKGGLEVAVKLATGNKPDYSTALTQMHEDFSTIERLRRDINNSWKATVRLGENFLAYLLFHADEAWCSQMFLRPARGDESRAKAFMEAWMLRFYHALRSRSVLWSNDPLLDGRTRNDIEREIWALWVLAQKQTPHHRRLNSGYYGGSMGVRGPWEPMPGGEKTSGKPGHPTYPKMFKADKEVTMRLGYLGVAVPQTLDQIMSIGRRGMKEGPVDLDGAVDTPEEAAALRKWAIDHAKGKRRMAARPQTKPRAPAMSLRALNPAAPPE